MRVAKLSIAGFRGIQAGDFLFHSRTAVVGPNGCGKSTIVDALSLVLGKVKMVRNLTEHDFVGSCPQPADRFRIVATITGFSSEEPGDNPDWFRMGRAVPKWIDSDGSLYSSPAKDRMLAGQLGFAARFDHADLAVETARYFHDDDDVQDPFADDVVTAAVPARLLADLGYFVLPARRTWEGVNSFNSELFRRTVSDVAGIPSSEVLQQRDDLRSPIKPLDESAALSEMVKRIDAQLASLMPFRPRFRLRVTSGDSEAVLQAMLPHYTSGGATLPASRHGLGLVSLQSLLLLLEVGRARRDKGLPFMLALEEPELHLSPGIQLRLVAEAAQTADQVICVTHSSRVAASFAPTDIFVMSKSATGVAATPYLKKPLAVSASNNERKLFIQNRPRVIDALMHPFVLVPEGRFDAEWLSRLSEIAEGISAPPFSTVCGIVPTENAAVTFTVGALKRIRPGVVALVDGDGPGDTYVAGLVASAQPPDAIIQWPKGWTIEDVVGWIAEAGGPKVLSEIQSGLGSGWKLATIADLVGTLRTSNDSQAQTFGLKEDVIAHDEIVAAVRQHSGCLDRIRELTECLVRIALNEPHGRAVRVTTTPSVPHYRFDAS